jgi:hypothetical protein
MQVPLDVNVPENWFAFEEEAPLKIMVAPFWKTSVMVAA